MSASRKTGPSRKSGRLASLVARSDATPQLTTLVGPGTPRSDYDPDGSPQSSAHVIKYIYGKPTLNENEKEGACGATNRCIITNEEVHNFCHLVGTKNIRRSGLEFLRIRWGFFRCPDGGWTYKVLPLDIDPPIGSIFRQQLQIEKKGKHEPTTSTGLYDDFAYPYSDLTSVLTRTPSAPCGMRGRDQEAPPGSGRRDNRPNLTRKEQRSWLLQSNAIQLLYELWVLPESTKPTADGTKSLHLGTIRWQAATQDTTTEDPFLGVLAGLGGDPFKSKPATEKDADPGTAISIVWSNAHDVRNVLRGDAPQSGSADSLARDFSFMFSFDNSTITRHFERTNGGGPIPQQDVLNANDTSHAVPNTDSLTQASSVMSQFGDLAIEDTSSAPARHVGKRKRLSTPVGDRQPVADGSPTTHVSQSLKLTVDGVTQSTASARGPISSLRLPSESESGTISTAQPPQGVDPPAQQASKVPGYPYVNPMFEASVAKSVAKKLEAKKARSRSTQHDLRRKQQQPPTQRSAQVEGFKISREQMEKAFTGGKPRIPTSEPAPRASSSRDLPKRFVGSTDNNPRPSGSGNPASTPRLAGGSGGGTNSVSSSKLKGKETGAGESKKEPAPKQQWR
ncbi:hypothetical protein B0H14DRAFT_2685431 [Mycena olivaceomarginata]|nr:hypothetical protein B0H14DRAFT_2685431 [Mycena olivaceomarginata]